MPETQQIEFIPATSAYGYTENTQAVPLRMSFLNKKGNQYKELFLPVMCRDYFSDVLHAEYWKISIGPMYGFTYNAKTMHIDQDAVRLSLHCNSMSEFQRIKTNCLQILNPLEKQAKFELSTLLQPTEKCLIIEGDKRWQSNTYLMAVYTLLLRTSGRPFETPDDWLSEYLRRGVTETDFVGLDFQTFISQPRFQKSLCKLSELADWSAKRPDVSPSGWLSDMETSTVHNYSGIWGISQARSSALGPMLKEVVG